MVFTDSKKISSLYLLTYIFRICAGENVQKLEKSDFDQNPIMAEMFFPNQTYVKEGDVIKNPKLAHTLELLNQHDYVFYHKDGTIGNELIEELNENVGFKFLK